MAAGCRCRDGRRPRLVADERAKMSKSLGNVVHPKGYTDRFGVDAAAYFVMREMVVGQDASFPDEVFLTRYNADLANDLGNVVSRTTTMIQRYCDASCRRRRPWNRWTRRCASAWTR
jgi:methionyl-tRNA synthetase